MNMTNCSPIEISNLEISDLKLLLTPLPDPHPTLLSAVNCSVYITVSGVARCIYIFILYTNQYYSQDTILHSSVQRGRRFYKMFIKLLGYSLYCYQQTSWELDTSTPPAFMTTVSTPFIIYILIWLQFLLCQRFY